MSDLQMRIDRARWWAIQVQPFYGTLAMRLTDKISDSCPTAATDGNRILWGRAYCEALSEAELRFVLLHETLHCAHQHLWRLPLTPAGNIAGDYVINAILRNVPGCTAPNGALYDKKYDGLSEEEVLAKLSKLPKNYVDTAGGWTESDPAAEQPGTLAGQWKIAVAQAAHAARERHGDVPDDMQRVIDAGAVRRIDWRMAMQDFVRRAVGQRNDWSRPSRRGAGRDYILPRRRRDALGTVIAVRDTSGSIDDRTLSLFNAAISAVCADTGAECIVLDCDAAVKSVQRLLPSEVPSVIAVGGGGTDFRPAFRRAEEIAADEPVSGIVYLTDLCGTFPDSCEIPVLWVSTIDGAAPFGRIVKIEE